MFVLTRRLSEEIVMGQRGITIKVLDIRAGRVRLGIVAPDDVRIERFELHPNADSKPQPHCPESVVLAVQ